MSVDWTKVARTLHHLADSPALGWRAGQDEGLRWIADRIVSTRGLLVADEVGLGKTRVAVAVMHAVAEAGGQVAAVVPPTLMHQWESEHEKFRAALGEAAARSSRTARDRRQLRHYLDLFPEEANPTYPLARGEPFLLVSHTFRLSARLGSSSKPYGWALPYIVRSRAKQGDWSKAPGLQRAARDDGRLKRQLPAAEWLARPHRGWANKLGTFPPLDRTRKPGQVSSRIEGEIAGNLRPLFHALIGDLLGRFDLVVIDEVQTSRENGDDSAQPRKRLSWIIEEILPYARGHRRLCLTATPVQLGHDDWRGTLRRIGLKGGDLEQRMSAIKTFEQTREALRSGPASEADVEALEKSAAGFESALADVVVRRRWDEQPLIAEVWTALGTDGAQAMPLRDLRPRVV